MDDDAEPMGKRTERLAREVEICAYLEAGVRGTGKPTDVYPDWVYEARDAIRRQDENPPHYLPELLAILGWSGGTYHQALKAIQRLVAMDKDRNLRITADPFANLHREYEDHVQYHRERRQEPMSMSDWCREEVRIEGPLTFDAKVYLESEKSGP